MRTELRKQIQQKYSWAQSAKQNIIVAVVVLTSLDYTLSTVNISSEPDD